MIATADPASEPLFVRSLDSLSGSGATRAGTKAATLGRLRAAGFPVPDGFVVGGVSTADLETADVRHAIRAALDTLGEGPVAVRSSAAAEDLPGASFAGQYESVLRVEGLDAVLAAIARVLASAEAGRVGAYHAGRNAPAHANAMAVLIQRMVPANVAGVAFTADPLTGERDRVIVSAVRGLGERLVSGEAQPDEWVVVGDIATARRTAERALDARLASAVAALARRVEAHEGSPQDIEWAAVGGVVQLVQARPMTALPNVVRWEPPLLGVWLRDFRLGEWLGAPVTPLFEGWLLTRLEDRFHGNYGRLLGISAPRPIHAVVNGWYFYGFNFLPTRPAAMLAMFIRHILPRLLRHPRRVAIAFPPLARHGIGLAERTWRTQIRPAYQRAVEDGWAEVETADAARLSALVDALADATGDYFTSVTMVAGYASKSEIPLAQFFRAHVAPKTGGSHLGLLGGLGEGPPSVEGHAVRSLDWAEPTMAEGSMRADPERAAVRHGEARLQRAEAEHAARAALTGEPKLLRRFELLVATAQRAAIVREEQIAEFTLAWPLMRRAVLRLGQDLAERGILRRTEDVFFLRHDELEAAVRGDATDRSRDVEDRRRAWQQQARLVPPLRLGEMPPMMARIIRSAEESIRGPVSAGVGDIVGIPASGGRARGPARVVHSPDEFGRVQPGDILVCPMTASAWTPLFDRIAGIVTDTGGVAAHASIVAREYGLPAIVGTGVATAILHDGEPIEIDGSAGVVIRLGSGAGTEDTASAG